MRYSENKILVPYDFSAEAEAALSVALDLATLMQAGITLLHVIELAPYESFKSKSFKTYGTELNRHLQGIMADKLASLSILDGQIDYKIVEGKKIEKIIESTKGGRYGLIVIGYRKVLLADEIASCTVEKIMRHATIPVLSINAPGDIKKVKQIAFASDLQTTPVYAIKQLSRLQHALHARLHVVKINTKENWISNREAQSQFDRFQEIQKLSNYEFKIYDDETTEEGVMHFADDIGAEMIAMGIHNATPGDKLLDHHIAEDILKKSRQILWTCTT